MYTDATKVKQGSTATTAMVPMLATATPLATTAGSQTTANAQPPNHPTHLPAWQLLPLLVYSGDTSMLLILCGDNEVGTNCIATLQQDHDTVHHHRVNHHNNSTAKQCRRRRCNPRGHLTILSHNACSLSTLKLKHSYGQIY